MPIPCNYCSVKCKDVKSLETHVQRKHKDMWEQYHGPEVPNTTTVYSDEGLYDDEVVTLASARKDDEWGEWEEAVETNWEPKVEGDTIEGVYTSFSTFVSPSTGNEVMKHIVLSDLHGPAGVVGGYVLDKAIHDSEINIGDYVQFRWLGKKALKGSKTLNLWRVRFRRAKT